MRRRRLPERNPALLAIVGEGFVSRLAFGMISFALPLYARELGMSLTAIGVLASLNMMVALALKPLMGRLADHIGLKLGLAAAIVGRSVVTAVLAIATVPWHLFGARALHGVSIAMRDPAVNALIAEHGGKRAIAQSFAWYQTAKSVGASLSKVAAGVLITVTASNFSLVFVVAFVLSLAPIVVVLRYVREPERAPEPEPAAAPAPATAPASASASAPPAAVAAGGASAPAATPSARRRALPYAGAGLLIGSSSHMLNTFFPILATEYAGLSAAQAGALYTVGALASLTGPAFGWVSDNVSRALVLQLRSVANVFSSVLYLVSPNLPGFAAGRLLDDLGKAAFRPAWGSMMAHVSSFDRRRRAQTMGYMSSGEDAGEMLGPILAGVLWSTGGVVVLMAGRIVLAISAEAYTVVLGRRLGGEQPEAPVPAPAPDPAPPSAAAATPAAAMTQVRAPLPPAERRSTAELYRSAANAARVRAAQAEAQLLLEETGRLLDRLDDALELVEQAGRLKQDVERFRVEPWDAPDPAQPGQPTKR